MSSAKLLLESWQLATSPYSKNKTSIDLSIGVVSVRCIVLRRLVQQEIKRAFAEENLEVVSSDFLTHDCVIFINLFLCYSVQTRKLAQFTSNSKKISRKYECIRCKDQTCAQEYELECFPSGNERWQEEGNDNRKVVSTAAFQGIFYSRYYCHLDRYYFLESILFALTNGLSLHRCDW